MKKSKAFTKSIRIAKNLTYRGILRNKNVKNFQLQQSFKQLSIELSILENKLKKFWNIKLN